jgi:hypothetical protein
MSNVELSKRDNRRLTLILIAGNLAFCAFIIAIAHLLFHIPVRNFFISSMLLGLLLVNLCVIFWLRNRNVVLYRNSLFITALTIPFAYAIKSLLQHSLIG